MTHLDCLISTKTDKAYIITKHNRNRCQSLWVANRKRYFRKWLYSIDEAKKYGKFNQYRCKVINQLNERLNDETISLADILKEYDNSDYQYLFEDTIASIESDIYATKESLKYFTNLKE